MGGTMSPRGKIAKQAEPKPCPTCFNAMKLVGKTWFCPKHGEPTRP